MSSLENLWPDPSVNKEIRTGGFGLPAGCQVAGSGGAHRRKFQRARRGGFAAITPQQSGAATTRKRPSRVGRLQPENAPAEWGGYNERKRDRHALLCSHVTPPSPRLWRTSPLSPRLWRTRLLTCSYPPLVVRAPQILQLFEMRPLRESR